MRNYYLKRRCECKYRDGSPQRTCSQLDQFSECQETQIYCIHQFGSSCAQSLIDIIHRVWIRRYPCPVGSRLLIQFHPKWVEILKNTTETVKNEDFPSASLNLLTQSTSPWGRGHHSSRMGQVRDTRWTWWKCWEKSESISWLYQDVPTQ